MANAYVSKCKASLKELFGSLASFAPEENVLKSTWVFGLRSVLPLLPHPILRFDKLGFFRAILF